QSKDCGLFLWIENSSLLRFEMIHDKSSKIALTASLSLATMTSNLPICVRPDSESSANEQR
ncbi:MAG TPA: hypothetical protein PK402_02495, partial [Tepidisphaeraceae bacterium]|nr:hypothetical protein [Tepidisphaeraceae bacterium]